MNPERKLLVLDVAALGWDLVSGPDAPPAAQAFGFRRAETVFPALTCTVQASFRTEALPCFHGLVGNGFFDRKLGRAMFWEQSAALVYGRRIWEGFRARGGRVGLFFWQQSLGESVDWLLSPRPIHLHEGGMIVDCHAEPPDLYARLRRRLRRGFPLHRYWGPLASAGSSAWIADALAEVVRRPDAPELVVGYLPHLDYDLQRHGPRSRAARAALEVVLGHLVRLREAAREAGYEFLCFGDYAMAEVTRPPVHPNRVLREAGLLRTYGVRGRSYPDLHGSPAFVLVDHEIAGVYARTPAAAGQARAALERAPGVGAVLDREAQRKEGIDDPDGADLVLVAEEGAWFAYPWWDDAREAPDYATHVDIHRKPGYDPCELHFGFPPPRVSLDPTRIRGTHGRAGPGRAIAWATTLGVPGEPRDVTALAKLAQDALEGAP